MQIQRTPNLRWGGRAALSGLTLLAACAVATRSSLVRTRDGAGLATTILGSSGPTVVVLHGGPGATHNYLRPEWDRLTSVGQVVYYDQRGCGGSTRRGPYTWQQHLMDLDDLVHKISPTKQVVLAGSSWGSRLALLYAREHPEHVSALVLTGVTPWPGKGSPLATSQDSAAAGLGRPTLIQIDTLPSIRVPLRPKLADSSAAPRFMDVCRGITVTRAGAASMPPLNALSRIQMPVLLLAGTDTSRYQDGSAELAGELPRSKRVMIDGAGHDPWLEQSDRFFTEVRSFLNSSVHPGITGVAAGTPQHTTATVFQDTALFRELCTQADSGLAPSVGRCTLRDQRREIVRPDS